jgi:hypothetical protein
MKDEFRTALADWPLIQPSAFSLHPSAVVRRRGILGFRIWNFGFIWDFGFGPSNLEPELLWAGIR